MDRLGNLFAAPARGAATIPLSTSKESCEASVGMEGSIGVQTKDRPSGDPAVITRYLISMRNGSLPGHLHAFCANYGLHEGSILLLTVDQVADLAVCLSKCLDAASKILQATPPDPATDPARVASLLAFEHPDPSQCSPVWLFVLLNMCFAEFSSQPIPPATGSITDITASMMALMQAPVAPADRALRHVPSLTPLSPEQLVDFQPSEISSNALKAWVHPITTPAASTRLLTAVVMILSDPDSTRQFGDVSVPTWAALKRLIDLAPAHDEVGYTPSESVVGIISESLIVILQQLFQVRGETHSPAFHAQLTTFLPKLSLPTSGVAMASLLVEAAKARRGAALAPEPPIRLINLYICQLATESHLRGHH